MSCLNTVLSATSYVLSAALPFNGLYNNASASISEEQPYVMDGVVSFGKDDPAPLTKPTTSAANQYEPGVLEELQQKFKTKPKKTHGELKRRSSNPNTGEQEKGPVVHGNKSVSQKAKVFDALAQSSAAKKKSPLLSRKPSFRFQKQALPLNRTPSPKTKRTHLAQQQSAASNVDDPVFMTHQGLHEQLISHGKPGLPFIYEQRAETPPPNPEEPIFMSAQELHEQLISRGKAGIPFILEREARAAKPGSAARLAATASNEHLNRTVNPQRSTEDIYAQVVKRRQKGPGQSDVSALRRSISAEELTSHPKPEPSRMSPQTKKRGWQFWK